MSVNVVGDGDLRYFKDGQWRDVGEPPKPTVTVSGEESDTVIDVGGTDYRVVVWESSGDLTVTGGDLRGVEFVVVGGGGGGGEAVSSGAGGGGGGGGVVFSSAPVSVPAGTAVVTVGAGGVPRSICSVAGSNSSFGLWTAVGGGGGSGAGAAANAGSGGSGGGTSGRVSLDGRRGFGFQGSDGGFGDGYNPVDGLERAGAGGGGFSAPGEAPVGSPSVKAGDGGAGFTTTITGTSLSLAGGGGGGCHSSSTPGFGADGGGDGGASADGEDGVNGTGGGGGAGGFRSPADNGGDGGDGIVIVRWPVENEA